MAEEGLRGKGGRGQSNRGADPVKQIPRAVHRARPDSDREQHDIHHRKPGHAQRQDQVIALAFLQRPGLIGLKPRARERGNPRCRVQPRLGRNAHPPLGQVHPRGVDIGLFQQCRFHRADAARAMNARQHQMMRRHFHLRRTAPTSGPTDRRRRASGAGGDAHFFTRRMMRC